MPRTIGDSIVREAPGLADSEPLGQAVARVVDSRLPALPVLDDAGALVGIFGEREFIAAIFPGYLQELRYAGFVTERIQETLEKRAGCLAEAVRDHMNTDHIDVGGDWSDAQLAEVFLHHRVLIIPVVEDGRVSGVVTRSDFFRALVEQALGSARK